ncbi:MAG: T9SS type A sorting domain-containing protein, partial [Flavobacteriales bacterium]|nr:T9SS type A sorting domain-containing protein [Flavobacteriales bacterium]
VNVKASNIYPNPVRIGQSIQLGLGTIETFKLFSIDGKQVPIELGNGTMKTDNLVAGIYLIRVEAGTGVTNQKLVVTD